MQLFEPRLDTKKRPSLLQYKQLIIELSDAVNSLNQQVEQLKCDINKLQTANNKLTVQLDKKQKDLQELHMKKKINLQSSNQKNTIIQDLKKYNQQLQASLKQASDYNQKLKQKLNYEIQKRNYHQRLNEVSIEKIRILQQNMEALVLQNKSYVIERDKKINFNQWQIKQLKQFNQQLKRKFEALEIDRPIQIFERSFQYLPHKTKEYNLKQKRSFSTEKKTRRNIGCLSTNNVSKGINKFKVVEEYSPIQIYKQKSVINPQLNSELQNLKKEIANQYTLINLKTQNYSKQRVSKTLEQLKRKMGKAIAVAQESESQSCMDL